MRFLADTGVKNNSSTGDGVDKQEQAWYPLCNFLRKGECADEAEPHRDVHDDAHVHVPHEHVLLCQSSLRFSITLTGSRKETSVPGG